MKRVVNEFKTWAIEKEKECFFISKTDESGTIFIKNREELKDLLEVIDKTVDVLNLDVLQDDSAPKGCGKKTDWKETGVNEQTRFTCGVLDYYCDKCKVPDKNETRSKTKRWKI